MKTAELELWQSLWRPLCGIPRLRWLRLALAGIHFQVDAVSFVHDHIFDCTGLVLRKGIRRYAHDGQRVLDLGTGHLGLLAVYCARTHNVKIVAVDVNEEFLENARLIAEVSGAPDIDFRQSDWFSNIDGEFDLIFGNVPYVPNDVGCAALHSHEHPEIWDGGCDGLDCERVILRNVGHYLMPHGILLLGIDTSFIPRIATLELVEASRDIELKDIIKSWISRSEIYVIGLRDHATSTV